MSQSRELTGSVADTYTQGTLGDDPDRLSKVDRIVVEAVTAQLPHDWGYGLSLRTKNPGEIWERFYVEDGKVHDREITHRAMRRVYGPHPGWTPAR